MEHSQIVLDFLLPADQQPSESVEPVVSALDHPAACPVARDLTLLPGFFTPRPNVISKIGSCSFFPPTGAWSSLRPCTATPSPDLPSHRTPTLQLATSSQTPPHPAMPTGRPFLEPIMDCAGGSQTTEQGFPLATSLQHVENGSHRFPVIHPGMPWLLLRPRWREQWLNALPELVRDLKLGVYAQTAIGLLLPY